MGHATVAKQDQHHPTSLLPPIQLGLKVIFTVPLFFLSLTFPDVRLLRLCPGHLSEPQWLSQRLRSLLWPAPHPHRPHNPQKAHGLRRLCQPPQPGPPQERPQGFPVYRYGRRCVFSSFGAHSSTSQIQPFFALPRVQASLALENQPSSILSSIPPFILPKFLWPLQMRGPKPSPSRALVLVRLYLSRVCGHVSRTSSFYV